MTQMDYLVSSFTKGYWFGASLLDSLEAAPFSALGYPLAICHTAGRIAYENLFSHKLSFGLGFALNQRWYPIDSDPHFRHMMPCVPSLA